MSDQDYKKTSDQLKRTLGEDFEAVAEIAKRAGEKILEVKNNPLQVQEKQDGSPVTIADSAAHKVIAEGLLQVSKIPFFSEEGVKDWAKVAEWDRFWLVDPLDGTKDFIRGTGDYTVNIALIIRKQAAWGVVYLPEKEQLFTGGKGFGSFCNGEAIEVDEGKRNIVAIESYSHPSEKNQEFYKKHGIEEIVRAGSSMKFCKVANGDADLYVRFGPTNEWDIAAGQAVLEGAGGAVVEWPSGQDMRYQKSESLNSYFLAIADEEKLAQFLSTTDNGDEPDESEESKKSVQP